MRGFKFGPKRLEARRRELSASLGVASLTPANAARIIAVSAALCELARVETIAPRGGRKRLVRRIARRYGVNVATLYRWAALHARRGLRAFVERRGRPRAGRPIEARVWRRFLELVGGGASVYAARRTLAAELAGEPETWLPSVPVLRTRLREAHAAATRHAYLLPRGGELN